MALSRGLAPRTLSFARRDAELLHLESVEWRSWPDLHRLIVLVESEIARAASRSGTSVIAAGFVCE